MEASGIAGERRPQILRSENLQLRAVEPADVDFLFELENDPSVWCAGNTIAPFSRFQIEQYAYSASHDIYTDKQLRLMIDTHGGEKKCVGVVDLFDFDPHHKRAGIGILIIPGERNKGYAVETIEIVKKYAHQILQLRQLYCSVLGTNEASANLFEKAGFVRTGTRKDWRFQFNQWVDEYFYQYLF